MRRLIGLAAYLYPAEWRRRYGAEFQCLLDDAPPTWRDLLDVVRAGLKLRLAGVSYVRSAIAWALIAFFFSAFVRGRMAEQYVATTVLQSSNPTQILRI